MRTLHMGLRVAHLERSLAFYAALGYQVIGSVRATSLGDLTMLKLPDDPFVAIELVSGSSASASSGGDSLSHFVIKVESMDAVLAELAAAGIHPDEPPVFTGRLERVPDCLDHRSGRKPDRARAVAARPPGRHDRSRLLGRLSAEPPAAKR
jgi:lactoylglutathione lyase